jgi:2-acylglycerol O-acyltransferase 2
MGGGSGPAGESVAEAYSGDADPSRHHVLELGNLPEAAAALPDDQRFKLVRSMIKSSKPGGFATDSQTHQCSMPWYQEFACVLVLGLWLGGPLFFFFTPILLCMFGTWTQISYFLAVTLVLALHPLPNLEEYLNKSAFSMWLYKYFSYRIMWSGDAYDKAQASAPWVGAAGPHSVMPFGSVLSIPGINTFVFRKFKGGTASVLGRVPLLRYLYLWGTIDVAGKSLSASLKQGVYVHPQTQARAHAARSMYTHAHARMQHTHTNKTQGLVHDLGLAISLSSID